MQSDECSEFDFYYLNANTPNAKIYTFVPTSLDPICVVNSQTFKLRDIQMKIKPYDVEKYISNNTPDSLAAELIEVVSISYYHGSRNPFKGFFTSFIPTVVRETNLLKIHRILGKGVLNGNVKQTIVQSLYRKECIRGIGGCKFTLTNPKCFVPFSDKPSKEYIESLV